MTDNQFKELGRQLSHPSGADGLQLADMMHETNIGMTTAAIIALDIKNNNNFLELGHGNCGHLNTVLNRADNVQYHGVEVSEDMFREAVRKNKSHIENGAAQFDLYDGITLPFEAAIFDRVMTVNTVYFWHNQIAMCKEVARVIKPGGLFAIAFVQKSFMQDLPFTREHFHLVDGDDVKKMMESAGLRIAEVIDKTEKVKTRTGELVDRDFAVVIASKDLTES